LKKSPNFDNDISVSKFPNVHSLRIPTDDSFCWFDTNLFSCLQGDTKEKTAPISRLARFEL